MDEEIGFPKSYLSVTSNLNSATGNPVFVVTVEENLALSHVVSHHISKQTFAL